MDENLDGGPRPDRWRQHRTIAEGSSGRHCRPSEKEHGRLPRHAGADSAERLCLGALSPVSGVNLLGFAQKCQEIEDFSHACLQQSVDSENTAASLQRFFSENWLNIAQIASGWSRDGESESGQLQHSRKVVEKQEAVI